MGILTNGCRTIEIEARVKSIKRNGTSPVYRLGVETRYGIERLIYVSHKDISFTTGSRIKAYILKPLNPEESINKKVADFKNPNQPSYPNPSHAKGAMDILPAQYKMNSEETASRIEVLANE
ncbi:MAG: hypothetical protein WCK90_05120 [archaeon]